MAKKTKTKKVWWNAYEAYYKYVILALPILIYASSALNQFAVDDTIVILDNEFTKQGIKGVPNILSEDTFLGFFKDESKSRIVSGGRYRPLSLVLFAIEYQIIGENPFLYHLINIILYALLGWLIYLCLPKWFNGLISKKQMVFFSFLISVLYIVHPIHTEAVANIKGRDEIMALLFCLWAYYIYERNSSNSLMKSILTGFVFFLGLLSKENAFTFVVIIPLIYWQLQKHSIKDALFRSIPFIIPGLIFLIIRSIIIGNDVSGVSSELMNNPFLKWNGNQYLPFAPSEKLALIANTFFQYIRLYIIPHPLTHDYYPKHIDATSFANIGSVIGLLLAAGMAAYAILKFKTNRIISFGLLFFGITISLVINLIFPIGTIMSERFLFMPSLGLSIVLGYLTFKGFQHSKLKSIMPWLFGIVVLLWSIKTITRNTDWKNNYILFSKDIRISKNSAKLNNALGGEIITQALKADDAEFRNEEIRRAITYLEKATELHPTYRNAFLLLGNAKYHLSEYGTAIAYYRRALSLDANYSDALNNLAVALRDAGKEAGEKKGNLQQALTFLKESEQLNNQDYETLRLLGVAYGMSQNHDNAIKYFTLALNIRPDEAQALFNLGLAYMNAGNTVQGESYINKAKSLNPNIGQQNAN